MRNKLKPVKCH